MGAVSLMVDGLSSGTVVIGIVVSAVAKMNQRNLSVDGSSFSNEKLSSNRLVVFRQDLIG